MPTVGKKAYNLAAISFTASTLAMVAYVNLTASSEGNEDTESRTATMAVANCLDELTRCYTAIEGHFTIPKRPETGGEYRAIMRNKMTCRAWNKAMMVYLGAAESLEAAYKNTNMSNVVVAQEMHVSGDMLDKLNALPEKAEAVDFVYALESIVRECMRGNKNAELVTVLTDTKNVLSDLRALYCVRLGQEPPYNADLADLMQKELIL